jgi:hypothetical protein
MGGYGFEKTCFSSASVTPLSRTAIIRTCIKFRASYSSVYCPCARECRAKLCVTRSQKKIMDIQGSEIANSIPSGFPCTYQHDFHHLLLHHHGSVSTSVCCWRVMSTETEGEGGVRTGVGLDPSMSNPNSPSVSVPSFHILSYSSLYLSKFSSTMALSSSEF